MEKLSYYAEKLNDETKTRYREKIALINGLESTDTVPPLDASDLVAYLVLRHS